MTNWSLHTDSIGAGTPVLLDAFQTHEENVSHCVTSRAKAMPWALFHASTCITRS